MKSFIINSNDANQRIDKFILKTCPDMPKSAMYKFIRTKKIKLNRKRCEISSRLTEGDTVDMYISDDFFSNKNTTDKYDFKNAGTLTDIIFEDSNIILMNKPEGLPSHNTNEKTADTLVNRLKKYLSDKNAYNPDSENSFAPALCNRLDRNTSGIVIGAKNAAALREMNNIIKSRYISKKYLCVTYRKPPADNPKAIAYHRKNTALNKAEISDFPKQDFSEIITGYKLLEQKKGLFLIEVTLLTGKFHQIRAFMSHIKCPLLGDNKYGNPCENKKYNVFHQMLCAYSVSFHDIPTDSNLAYLNGKEFHTPEKPFENLFS